MWEIRDMGMGDVRLVRLESGRLREVYRYPVVNGAAVVNEAQAKTLRQGGCPEALLTILR